MNKIVIIGNTTNAAEIRTTQNGTKLATFTVAASRRFDKSTTDFFRVNAWRGLADVCANYIVKGSRVAVIGELQIRIYKAKDGTEKTSLDVTADEVEFLSPKQERPQITTQKTPNLDNFEDISSDDLPWGA